MEGWVASLVVIANGATSTELSSLFCFVNLVLFLCLICMCFLRVVCVFSCVYTCPMGVFMNDLDLVNGVR